MQRLVFVAAIAFASGCMSQGSTIVEGAARASASRAALNDQSPSRFRDVLLVGNSVSGTVTLIDGRTYAPLGAVDVLPDRQSRLAEIGLNPLRKFIYWRLRRGQILEHFEPAGGDRFVDDVFLSPDGATLYVSRSNLGDLAAFDMTASDHRLLWRYVVPWYKADHATLSPDGSRIVLSATLADLAVVLDAATGNLIGQFPTGHFPHQNDYSADGKVIYNGSIGDVSKPFADNAKKGERLLTVADASTLRVIKTYAFKAGLRPSVVTPDGKTMYAQLSYLNGVIKYDLTTGSIITTVEEPYTDFAKANYATPDDYPHNSTHHGLSLSGDGTKLCDAGTIDNTVSIISTATMRVLKTIDTGLIPYWATTSADGLVCFVSLSGDNAVAVIDFDRGQEIARVPVGKFPQRTRLGRLPASELEALSSH